LCRGTVSRHRSQPAFSVLPYAYKRVPCRHLPSQTSPLAHVRSRPLRRRVPRRSCAGRGKCMATLACSSAKFAIITWASSVMRQRAGQNIPPSPFRLRRVEMFRSAGLKGMQRLPWRASTKAPSRTDPADTNCKTPNSSGRMKHVMRAQPVPSGANKFLSSSQATTGKSWASTVSGSSLIPMVRFFIKGTLRATMNPLIREFIMQNQRVQAHCNESLQNR
jgi:hypothetical protein